MSTFLKFGINIILLDENGEIIGIKQPGAAEPEPPIKKPPVKGGEEDEE